MSDVTEAAEQVPAEIDPRQLGKLNETIQEAELDGGVTVQFVSFKVDGSEYGIDIMAVREIKGWTDVTSLPNTPEHVRGVLNRRGVIVPIFDLRCRFGHGLTDASPLHVVIIVAVGERIMGLLVDAVSDILTISSSEIMPVPQIENRAEQRFLDGLVTVSERMVALLQIERLFDLDALVEDMANAAE